MPKALTEDAYEIVRASLFEAPKSGSATEAKQRLANAIADDPLPLMLWLVDADVARHVVFRMPGGRTCTITAEDYIPPQNEEAL